MSTSSTTPVEEVILNWTDLTGKKTGATALGSNKFYKAQIFDLGGSFKVVFNYGRVGQAGQTQEVVCSTLAAAKKALEKKVNEKVAKGYTRIEMRSDQDELAKAKAKGVKVGTPKEHVVRTRVHPEVEAFLKIVYGSTGAAVATGLSSTAGASKDAPLGNLSDKQLDKGADILDEVERRLKGAKQPTKDELVELTNEFSPTSRVTSTTPARAVGSTSTPSSSTATTGSAISAPSSASSATPSSRRSCQRPRPSMTPPRCGTRPQVRHRTRRPEVGLLQVRQELV